MRLFINAGGKGERLLPLTRDVPKPMIEIEGKSVIEHLIDWAKKHGIDSIVIMSGYKAEVIERFFGDGSRFGIPIYHSVEREPLGSGGGIKLAQKYVNGPFVYISGDHICDVDLTKMINFHKDRGSQFTVLVHESTHPYDSDILNVDENSRVTKFISKRDDHTGAGILSNSGLCIMEPEILFLMEKDKFEFEGYLYPRVIERGMNMFAYYTEEFMKDMGTPDRLEICRKYLERKRKVKTVILYGESAKDLYGNEKLLPMIQVAGKPFLEHQINFLKKSGLRDIILCGNDDNKIIQSYFGDGTRYNVNITYCQEDFSLGTAGAIKSAEKYIDGSFIVLNGDSLLDVDLRGVSDFHNCRGNALGTLVFTEVDDVSGYGSILMNGDVIEKFVEKGLGGRGMVNTGIYVFSKDFFDRIPVGKSVSLEKDIFPFVADEGRLYGFFQSGIFIAVDRPETYRMFKKNLLNKIQISESLLLREAMKIIDENEIDLLIVVDYNERFRGVLNDNIIRRFIVGGGSPEENVSNVMIKNPRVIGNVEQSEEEIDKLLRSGTRHLPILDEEGKIHDLRFPKAEMEIKSYPIVRGKSPLRISFAGGGTDMPYYFEENGGVVISTTIDKYCYVTAAKRADSKLVINSDLVEEEVVLDTKDLSYGGKFDLVKAIFNIIKPRFGVDLYLHNDILPGRGLGSSASFAVLIAKVIGELSGRPYDDETIAEIAYRAEVEELGIIGGKQDQYAAVFGGFNWIEFTSGDKKIMHPLRLKSDTVEELRSHVTLCYTGAVHKSLVQQESQKKTFEENREDISRRLEQIKAIANKIKENLLSVRPNFKLIGELLHESWQYKRNLSSNISNSDIDRLYDAGIGAGAFGGKVLGSGGGGYILFLHSPRRRRELQKALEKMGGEILNFNFEEKGMRIWYRDKYQ